MMMDTAHHDDRWRTGWLRKVMWSGAAALLGLPAVAMRFTDEVRWTSADFVFAAVLLFGAAGLIELAMRASSNLAYRAGAVAGVGASVLTIWADAAVGMIGPEGNPYNGWFLGVVAIAWGGAALARFRARGTATAMVLAAVAQLGASIGGMASDPRGAALSACFAAAWLVAAALFLNAARQRGQHA